MQLPNANRMLGECVLPESQQIAQRNLATSQRAMARTCTSVLGHLGFQSRQNAQAIALRSLHDCPHCGATLLADEDSSFCCRKGKLRLIQSLHGTLTLLHASLTVLAYSMPLLYINYIHPSATSCTYFPLII